MKDTSFPVRLRGRPLICCTPRVLLLAFLPLSIVLFYPADKEHTRAEFERAYDDQDCHGNNAEIDSASMN
jgi:hypothetical protein